MTALLTTNAQFERVAKVIAERVAQLLCASVFVIDQHAIAIASNDPKLLELSFDRICGKLALNYLRIPFTFETQVGEVIIGKSLNGEAISPHLAQGIVELVVNQTTIIDALPNQHQFKNKFISDLLHGLADKTTVFQYSKLLGLDLAPPRAVILIDASDYILGVCETQQKRRIASVIDSIVNFFHLPNDTICAYLGDGEVAVLKASDTKNLGTWANQGDVPEQSSSSWANLTALKRASEALVKQLRKDTDTSISIGVGRYHPGIWGYAQSYRDARAALSLGCRFHDRNQVHCLDGLGIAAFIGVADEQTKIELATYLLSPLNHEPELLATLDAFFAKDCCPSTTASQLSIHRNTLSYRLEKITLLTGLDPRRFDNAVQIRLALLMRRLR
ncbi:PucR family transcriptional regulator [Scytonema sp. NUACC26]|uniref:PucR family transcriptional regulator n=1 Tax=Scytonema sp. NUACC26 TaxID=3140176 RepID=UPI0034DB924F